MVPRSVVKAVRSARFGLFWRARWGLIAERTWRALWREHFAYVLWHFCLCHHPGSGAQAIGLSDQHTLRACFGDLLQSDIGHFPALAFCAVLVTFTCCPGMIEMGLNFGEGSECQCFLVEPMGDWHTCESGEAGIIAGVELASGIPVCVHECERSAIHGTWCGLESWAASDWLHGHG